MSSLVVDRSSNRRTKNLCAKSGANDQNEKWTLLLFFVLYFLSLSPPSLLLSLPFIIHTSFSSLSPLLLSLPLHFISQFSLPPPLARPPARILSSLSLSNLLPHSLPPFNSLALPPHPFFPFTLLLSLNSFTLTLSCFFLNALIIKSSFFHSVIHSLSPSPSHFSPVPFPRPFSSTVKQIKPHPSPFCCNSKQTTWGFFSDLCPDPPSFPFLTSFLSSYPTLQWNCNKCQGATAPLPTTPPPSTSHHSSQDSSLAAAQIKRRRRPSAMQLIAPSEPTGNVNSEKEESNCLFLVRINTHSTLVFSIYSPARTVITD